MKVESEVITAMKDTFSSAELRALRNDLIHDVLIDSREAAEGKYQVIDQGDLQDRSEESGIFHFWKF